MASGSTTFTKVPLVFAAAAAVDIGITFGTRGWLQKKVISFLCL